MFEKKIDWVYSTYEKQLYPTFGQVISQFSTNDSLLYVGLRNPEFQVINVKTGKKQWSYIEENGGWISGDPLVHNDTVYIGGSDNHEMFAFNSLTGKKYWTYFSKPAIWNDYLLFATGDAYNVWGLKPGTGYLYALNRNNGTILNFHRFNGNLYSGLVVKDNFAYFGSSDGYFYCVDLLQFTEDTTELSKKGYNSFDIVSIEPNPFTDSIRINLKINYNTELSMDVFDIEDNYLFNIFSEKVKTGVKSLYWNAKDNKGEMVVDGYYFIVVGSNDFVKKMIIQKKKPE